MADDAASRQRVLGRLTLPERLWVLDQLRSEPVGGALLLLAAAIALIWANSPWGGSYAEFVDYPLGLGALSMTVGEWASSGLLAIFFFVVGLELKHELVVGSLSKPSKAAVPIAAALGGMAVPALVFVGINLAAPDGSTGGWGIPMATDIAFALAVLAVVGRRLPVPLRAFLLTLAVVDDMGAITVIALFFTDALHLAWLAGAFAAFILYWLAQRRRIRSPLVYIPLALAAWFAMHESGVHATVTGVILGLLTRVRTDPGEVRSPADRLSHTLHPWSACICAPLFALTAAGVDLRSIGLGAALATPVAIGVILGLVIVKPVGVFGTAWIVARTTRARLAEEIAWRDVLAIGVLAGIGFTVALFFTGLSFGTSPLLLDSAKAAVLASSVIAAVLAALVLLSRNRHYRAVAAVEEADLDRDGIPDVYQRGEER